MSQRARCKGTRFLIMATIAPVVLAGCLSSDDDADTVSVDAEVSGLGPGELELRLEGEDHDIDEDGTVELAAELTVDDSIELEVTDQPEAPAQQCAPDEDEYQPEDDLVIEVSCVTPLAIEGEIGGPDPSERTVVLEAGDQSFETESDEDGGFAIDVELDDPWAVVALDTSGEPDRFRSYLGSPVGLYEDGGMPAEDQVNQVDESVTGRVNPNHLNTATAGALVSFNDGEDIESYGDLRDAAANLLTEDTATIAGAFVEVSNDERSLSDWDDYYQAAKDFADALEWAEDDPDDHPFTSASKAESQALYSEDAPRERAPMRVYESGYDAATGLPRKAASDSNDSVTEAIEEATVADAQFDELPDTFFIVGGFQWANVAYAAKVDTVGGTAWLRDGEGTSGPGAFSLDDGDLVISLEDDDEPHNLHQETLCWDEDEEENVDCEIFHYQDQMTVTQVLDGFGSDMVLMEVEQRSVSEEIDGDWSDEESFTIERFVSMMVPGDNEPLEEDEVASLLALDLPGEQWRYDDMHEDTTTTYSDILELPGDGSGELRYLGMPHEWEITEQDALRFRDISSGAVEDYHAWQISGDEDGTGFMLIEPVHDESWPIRAGASVAKDSDFFFTSSDLEGRWEQWGDEDRSIDSFVLDYSGSGDTAYMGPPEDSDVPGLDVGERPHLFEMVSSGDDPEFRIARLAYSEDGEGHSEKPPSFDHNDDDLDPADYEDADNVVFEVRHYQVIAEEDDRIYVAFNRDHYTDDDPDGDEWDWERELVPAMNRGSIRYFVREGDHEID